MQGKRAQFRGYALVRNAEGKPKFDDIFNIPVEIWLTLADHEKREIETAIIKRNLRGDKDGSYPRNSST